HFCLLRGTSVYCTLVTLAEILARGKAEKGSGNPPESRLAPRLCGRVYTLLPPRILAAAAPATPPRASARTPPRAEPSGWPAGAPTRRLVPDGCLGGPELVLLRSWQRLPHGCRTDARLGLGCSELPAGRLRGLGHARPVRAASSYCSRLSSRG